MAKGEMDIKIGQLLRKQRILRGYTQSELGAMLGITFQQIQKYETGLNRVSFSSLLVMLAFLKIKPADFFDNLVDGSADLATESNIDVSDVQRFLGIPVKIRKKVMSLMSAIYAEEGDDANVS